MKYQRQSLIEEKQKSNFYGLTNTSKAINIVPIRVSQSEALYEYLEKEAPDLDIDLLDAMNSLFTTR